MKLRDVIELTLAVLALVAAIAAALIAVAVKELSSQALLGFYGLVFTAATCWGLMLACVLRQRR